MLPGTLVVAGGASGQRAGAIEVASSGGGAVVPAGLQAYVTLPRGLTVTGWDLLASAVDTFSYDVQQTTYANFPAGVASIWATVPALAAAQKNQARNLSIALAQYQVLVFVISGVPASAHVTLALYVSG